MRRLESRAEGPLRGRSAFCLRVGMGLIIVLASLMVTAAPSFAREVPVKNWWVLDFKISKPHVRNMQDDDGEYKNFIYFTYTVSNKTEEKIYFCPDFLIETDVNTRHWDGLFHKLQYQLETMRGRALDNAAEIVGFIEPGETKEGIAIFRGVDDRADRLIFYCFGFTNAYRFDDRDENKILYRVWKIIYNRPGDEIDRFLDKLIFEDQIWDYHGIDKKPLPEIEETGTGE